MTTAAGRPLLQDKRSNSEEVVPLDSQVLYLCLDIRFGFLVLEQTSTMEVDVSSTHIFVAMFTPNLVLKCKMLEGLDIALILDDVPGVVNHWSVRAATLHNWIFHSFLLVWMLIVEASEVADRFLTSLIFIKACLWHTFESLIDSGCQPDWISSHRVSPICLH